MNTKNKNFAPTIYVVLTSTALLLQNVKSYNLTKGQQPCLFKSPNITPDKSASPRGLRGGRTVYLHPSVYQNSPFKTFFVDQKFYDTNL